VYQHYIKAFFDIPSFFSGKQIEAGCYVAGSKYFN